jgi:zinc/manganese transport system permease protein
MGALFEAGLWSSGPVHTAVIVGAVASAVCAVTGVFAVLRRQSFAAHALTDVATTGGATATYVGVGALGGFLTGAVVGATAMDALGGERGASRDVATGVVLGAATGLSALVLYLEATERAVTGVVQSVLFGSIFTVPTPTVWVVALISAAVVIAVAALARPLLLSTLSPDLAAAAGVRPRLVGLAFALPLAVSVGVSSLAIGSVLSTALVIGPAAIGCRWGRTVGVAVVTATAVGVASTALGVVLAYDSADWIAGGR